MNKTEEDRAVRDFLARFSNNVTAVRPRDEPDFELKTADGRTIALEVTELVVSGQAAGVAATRRLCADLRRALSAEGLSLAVTVFVRQSYALLSGLSRKRQRQLVDVLMQLVRGDIPADDSSLVRHEGTALAALGLHEIDAVSVRRGRKGPSVNHGSIGMGARQGFVQGCIDKKNANIDTYRANMPGVEHWLLLVSGYRPASGVWYVMLQEHVYCSAFDRTLCIDYHDHMAFEVETTPSASFSGGRLTKD